ncbi:hypothetical protein EfmAA290_33630 (plasmid) [Enterococcus faecium]|nr:hypothetical protein EfmAA290_33630 [Enterococcus faecium]
MTLVEAASTDPARLSEAANVPIAKTVFGLNNFIFSIKNVYMIDYYISANRYSQ